MIRIVLLTLCMVPGLGLSAQNNGVFNGGTGHGWSTSRWAAVNTSNIFDGGVADGYSRGGFSTHSNSLIFAGASGDGYSAFGYSDQLNSDIYSGGTGDGYDIVTLIQSANNSIFAGGSHDGADVKEYRDQTNGFVFEGGAGDGYSVSGLSKLIWIGGHSNDWLVASNWSLDRVPTQNDLVVIPDGLPHDPVLEGKLLINSIGMHQYTCRGLHIETSGLLSGTDAAWFENYGLIRIEGSLEFIADPMRSYINAATGHILIRAGGLLMIDH